MAGSGGETRDPAPATDATANPQSQEQTSDPSPDPRTSEDVENPEPITPEQQAQLEAEEHVRELLKAYQDTVDFVEELPAVVWVPWEQKGLGRYFKVPYMRWFLTYFVSYHIGRSLDTLSRRWQAVAALSGNGDDSWKRRELMKLYLQSLPRTPYRFLIFAAILAALVVALPLQAFGNAFYVLDLVGAMLRFNVGYVGRALQGNEIGPTLRSLGVLLVGMIVVCAILTSPFGLKRILFNLHPSSTERLGSTAARSHGYRTEGLYALEERVFSEAGIKRPHEGRWDLGFQAFLVGLLFVFGMIMALLTLAVALGGNVRLNVDTGAPAEVRFFLPEVSWVYYAVFTAMVLGAFALLLRRLISAWKKRE